MAFVIEISKSAKGELKSIKLYDRKRIINEMDNQLTHEPNKETRNKKPILDVAPGFEHVPPLWELRVGMFRVFYDVDEKVGAVYVRAIREKLPEQTTDEVIQ